MYNRKTRRRSPGNFASAWPELIIASDVRGYGSLQTEGQTSQPGYILRRSPDAETLNITHDLVEIVSELWQFSQDQGRHEWQEPHDVTYWIVTYWLAL